MSNIRIIRTISAILLSAMFLAACQQEAEQRPAGEVVQERAQARWDHRIAQEYAKAWEYFTPGYRETSPVDQYVASIQRRPVRWEVAEVLSADCEEARCDVVVELTYSLPRASAGLDTVKSTRPISETWIFSRGQWWFTPAN